MSTDARRQSLSISDLLNPPAEFQKPEAVATTPPPPTQTSPPQVESAEKYDVAASANETSRLQKPVHIKTEISRGSEFDDEDQELLAAAAVGTNATHCAEQVAH